ncbi:hypothetical protein D3C71_1857500 [compost metagenome]
MWTIVFDHPCISCPPPCEHHNEHHDQCDAYSIRQFPQAHAPFTSLEHAVEDDDAIACSIIFSKACTTCITPNNKESLL